MRKMRLLIDCEHGEVGKILDVDDCQVLAFLSEGRSELVEDEPPAEEPEPVAVAVAPVQEPKIKAKPAPKPPRGSHHK